MDFINFTQSLLEVSIDCLTYKVCAYSLFATVLFLCCIRELKVLEYVLRAVAVPGFNAQQQIEVHCKNHIYIAIYFLRLCA